jgi:hypothetical protein
MPISNINIKNAHAIFGPNITNIRGEMVWCKPERVITDSIGIPHKILNVHSHVTLVVDVMFVNSIPFLVSASLNINLIMIGHAPHHTATKLVYLLKCIVHVHAWAHFMVQTILMDNKFDYSRYNFPLVNMNIPAAVEHIYKIEQCIWVIKERAQGILICTLPYSCLPQQMLIHLLHFLSCGSTISLLCMAYPPISVPVKSFFITNLTINITAMPLWCLL